MEVAEQWNTLSWHLIHTHPRQEARVEFNLRTLDVETYVPLYERRRHNRITGAKQYQYKPLFPRYVFARFKVNDLYHKVRFTRGVRDLVSFNKQPAVVDENLIALIRLWQERTNGWIKPGFKPGDEIIIKEGPFAKLRAIFERPTSDAERVVLLLDSVGYQARVIVDLDSIAAAAEDGL